MPTHRQTITNALLGTCSACWITGVVLVAGGEVVAAVVLFIAGGAALASGLWMMLHRRKRLVVPRDVQDAFARSGSIMGEPPRYDSGLRKKR